MAHVIELSNFLFNLKEKYLYEMNSSKNAILSNNIILLRLNLKFYFIVMND